MIHTVENNNLAVSPSDQYCNPFYLLFSNEQVKRIPLPLAVKQSIPEALQWRNEWDKFATQENKEYCLYHPILKNWIGGAEDGPELVHQCLMHYANRSSE